MPNHTSLTYAQLYQKLRELRFQEYSVELDGKRGRVFEQEGVAGSMLVLPERDPNALVESLYTEKVLLTLRRLNLLPESNPLMT
jgi:hypothetical protein